MSLLGKEVLIRTAPLADPNDVIGAKYAPVPDGKGGVDHVIEGYQTVDFNTLSKRFKDFNIPIDTKRLQELNGLRNHIEHRYTDQPAQAVREATARAFPITVAMFQEAGEHPADVLGESWPIMLDVRALYEAELARCRATLAAVDWVSATVAEKHLRCQECGSDLISSVTAPIQIRRLSLLSVEAVALNPIGMTQSSMPSIARSPMKPTTASRTRVNLVQSMTVSRANGTPISISKTPVPRAGKPSTTKPECMRCSNGIPIEDALAGFDEELCSYCTHIMGKDD